MSSSPARLLIDDDVDQEALVVETAHRFHGEFEILQLVAASATRALFVVRDRVLKRRVALRVHLVPGGAHRTWFERETELMGRLDHPTLRTVHAAGYRGEWAFRVVRWIDGESLADAVARGARPLPGMLQLARQLTAVLDYVHSQQIVIRHLIPATIMLEHTERAFVTDLRYANVLLDAATDDHDPAAMPYRAPETRGGESGEPWSDIYGAGALLYFAVTGSDPDLAPRDIVSPRTLRPACPQALERVILRALEEEPSNRYLTAAEMREDLLSDLGDHPLPTPLAVMPGTPGEDALGWEKRLRRALGDDYELLEPLGSGGFGRVYRARDLALEREVALKVLHPFLTVDPAVVERFRREARLAAQVLHPNIANTYEIGGRTGLIWYTMEYVRGKNLAQLVRSDGPLPVERVVRMLREALAALSYAHARGLVHRDLKPENLIIETGTGNVRILDFGLALALQRAETLAGATSHSGTPEYAAPEQLLGERVDHRADLYSLAVAASFALTGQPPFGAGTVEAILARQSTGRLPDITSHRADVPDGLVRVLAKAAAPDVENRFESAEAFSRALGSAMRPWRARLAGYVERVLGGP